MKREIIKIIIVLFTTIISLALHSNVPVTVPITQETSSFVVNKLSFIGTVTLFFIIAYYIIASLFLRYESKLKGSKISRAFVFGCLIGGIWWVGMIEGVFAFGTKFLDEFLTGLLDFIPIVSLCVLLSFFLVSEKNNINAKGTELNNAFLNISIFVLVFVIGRGIRYEQIIGGYDLDNILLLMLWTTFFAIVISLNYIFFKNAVKNSSVVKSALQFTFIIFGLHYMMFVYFVPLIFKGMFFDLTIILIYDLLLVFIASIACYKAEGR